MSSLKAKCPAFENGCPYSNVSSSSKTWTPDLKSKCPAFENGCPFTNLSAKDAHKLLQTIPVNHRKCPASSTSLTSSKLVAMCTDGRIFVDQFISNRLDMFIIDDNENIENNEQFSSALRRGTSRTHTDATQRSKFILRLLRGQISKNEYRHYLLALYCIYKTLEKHLKIHSNNAILSQFHFSKQLDRTVPLERDLKYYFGARWHDHINPSPAVLTYINRLNILSECNQPELLLAHSYTRYLGDLSGGQIMKRRVQSAFNLTSKKGIEFFEFPNIGGQRDIIAFKDLYRDRLNLLLLIPKQADDLVAEANTAYGLSMMIVSEIDTLDFTTSSSSDISSSSSSGGEEENDNDADEQQWQQKASSIQIYQQISYVIAIIVAASFVYLYVGGYFIHDKNHPLRHLSSKEAL